MKISVNDLEIFSLNQTKENVIKYDVNADIYDADMARRLQWVLMHKYECVFEKMKSDWMPILQKRYETIPSADDALAELIMSQPDYKDSKSRALDEQVG